MAVEVFGESEVSAWDIVLAGVVLVASLLAARTAKNATTHLAARQEGLSEGARRTL
jgi:hypothetical protein